MNRTLTATGLVLAFTLALTAGSTQAIVVQPPPTPIVGGAVAFDPYSGSGGGAVGQCDVLLIACAGAAVDAGSACFHAQGAIGFFNSDFEVCASWGVAAEASMSHLVVQSSETGFAKVTSHMADSQVTRGGCEITGYVHDYVQEECHYWSETIKGDSQVSLGVCDPIDHSHQWSVPPTPSEILQINSCASFASEVNGAICHDAEASANGQTTGFESAIDIATSSCNPNNTKDRAQDMAAAFSAQNPGLDIPRIYLKNYELKNRYNLETASVVAVLLGNTEDQVKEALASDLSPEDQATLKVELTAAFQEHLDALSKTFDGNPTMAELGTVIIQGMSEKFASSLDDPGLTVLLVAQS